MNRSALSLLLVLPFAVPLAACGSDGSDNKGTGGSSTGSGATGGATTGSGGSSGSAGKASGTGGSGTGGSGTGGSGTGGSGTGGSGTGGSGTGGSGTGGSGTGGSGTGGSGTGGSGTGGAMTGGAGGSTGGASPAGGSAGSGTGGSSAGSGAGGSSGTSSGDYQGVLQHHGDAVRDGLYIDAAISDGAKTLAVDSSFAATYGSDNVYAQPLYLVGAGGKPDQVFVFTDGNKAYGFDASSGMQTWTKSFGTALTANPCGSFGDNGGFGITGTPVIDPVSRTIYFANASSSGGTVHQVHAINADTGEELMGWPVNVTMMAKSGSTTFDSSVQKQRAGLALLNGKVFVGFGGHVGDCGGYHGWVVSVDTMTQAVTAWATRAIGGAVWGASGIASDGTSLFFTTGNSKKQASDGPMSSSGDGGGMWGDSETIYKFPTSLTVPTATTDFFLPTDWVSLDDGDHDMGGTAPILMDVAGATPSTLVVSLGKDGYGYLVDRTNLGGMDATPLSKVKVGGTIINAMAGYHTAMGSYVVFKGGNCPMGQSGGLSALKISAASPPVLSLAWCGGPMATGSPSVTSKDSTGAETVVWAVGSDNKLYGVDGDTGMPVVNAAVSGKVATIQVPIVAKGRIFVASNTAVTAFKP
ncbi:MAG TPA: hypothetical protein VMI54_12030 [Polyangiaceae bacterium]|nr:hypothetical protein [Polyangiaceae bacterium]